MDAPATPPADRRSFLALLGAAAALPATAPAARGTPATPLNVASIATMKARWSDVCDPGQACVPTEYFYQATSDFLPWMKMGRKPGFLVWHEAGRKLASLDEAPREALAAVAKIHPQWLRRPVPWEGFTNMFLMYKEQRGPRR